MDVVEIVTYLNQNLKIQQKNKTKIQSCIIQKNANIYDYIIV